MDRLLRIERFRWQGQNFETWIVQHAEGRYTAKTRIGARDCIVTDGETETEALRANLQILPLTLQARGMG
jgi:hypothetical protein